MMKLIIAWLRKDGSCRRWTNSKPHEHAAMSMNVYTDAMKRLGKEWKCSAYEAAETVNKFFKSKENQTNADRIRSMTDEELAEFYTKFCACAVCEYKDEERDTCGAPTGFLCTKTYAKTIILDWLKSPAESEG